MNSTAILARGLVKSYGAHTAVDGVDLRIEPGEIFGLLGPNGAGKTTLIECVVGLRRPTSGTVEVLGLDPATDRAAFTRLVAVQPQAASLIESLTVAETLRLFRSFHERPLNVDDVLVSVDLADQRGTRVGRLSGGQNRRLLIAVAVIGNPRVIVLDEPSAGLDPAARRGLWALIAGLRELDVTVLLTTHHMDEAMALCDRVGIMVEGRIVALGSPDELVRQRRGNSRVEFTVPAADEHGVLDRWGRGSQIESRQIAGGVRIAIATDDPDRTLREITFAPELHARDIAVHRDSLEDLFLELAARS